MIAKLISFFVLLTVSYAVIVFVVPEFADQYGNTDINTRIRLIKDLSLNYASGSQSPVSLADKLLGTGKSLIDETKQTADQIQLALDEKKQQAKKAAESAQKAYDAVSQARQDFQNLTSLSGSSQSTLSGSTAVTLSGSIQ